MFVVDLADDFLQHVFHGDDAGGPAVFVEHDGQVGLEALHVGQHVLDLAGGGDQQGLPHQGRHRLSGIGLQGAQEVFGVHYSDDVI